MTEEYYEAMPVYRSELPHLKGSVSARKRRELEEWRASRTHRWSVLLALGILAQLLPVQLYS